MGKFRKNKKTASTARGRIDKAQNSMLKSMKQDIDELKGDIEAKYNIDVLSQVGVKPYDGSTDASRKRGINVVSIGDAQGTTDRQRIGDSVSLKHVDFNYQLTMPYTTGSLVTQPATTVRALMFWDNMPNAVTTAGLTTTNPVYWPNLLQNCELGATTVPEAKLVMLSEYDWDSRKRFAVIYDKTHTLAPSYSPGQATGGSASDGGLGSRSCTGVIKFNKNYKRQKIRYTSGGGIPQNRQLYVAFISDAEVAATTSRLPLVTYSLRTIYEDL